MYYECLQKYDKTEDLKSLYEFLKYETEKTWEKTLSISKGRIQDRKDLSEFTNNI